MRSSAVRLPAGVLLAVVLAAGCSKGTSAAPSSSWHVSPAGTSDGTGALTKPWDLSTALSHPGAVRPNDTIWLHAGTYTGNFISALAGGVGANNQIVVRAISGDRVTIDGSLEVRGQHTVFWGFEIFNSNPNRVAATVVPGQPEFSRPTGLVVHGPGTKIINLIVHDAGNGVGLWTTALDAELHGSIVYNNGWQGADRGYGAGVQAQNNDGIKKIEDNIVFQQFENGIVTFGTDQAFLTGFDFQGNISFDNGIISAQKAGVDFFIGGGSPAARVTLKNNYTYRTDGLLTARFGYEPTVVNKDIVVSDNYFVGQVGLANWETATFTGNTLTGAQNLLELKMPPGHSLNDYSWEKNKYYPDMRRRALNSTSLIVYAEKDTGKGYDFDGWVKGPGHDRGGSSGPKPVGQHVFVRPNKFEAGRANIVVYNWDHAATASVDLSNVLKNGEQYEIHDVQDLFGKPIASGTFTGAPRFNLPGFSATPVEIPLKTLPRATPVGMASTPAPDAQPEFFVFVVTRTATAPSP